MTCPACAGALETSPNGSYARCKACKALYMTYGGNLTPVQIPAGTDPELFAAGVGFAGAAGGPVLPPDPMTATRNALAARAANMGVRAKVGGVQIDMSRGGIDVDTSRLQKNIERKIDQKISGWIFGCIFMVFFFGLVTLIIVSLGGYIFYEATSGGSAGSAAVAKAAAWDGSSTFVCPANGAVTIEDVTANVTGTAIKAGGNCDLTLDGVNITADIGIDAGGNATVTIKGGSITGGTNSIKVGANATVVVNGATITGPTAKAANGSIEGM
ncbi:MAG: hypothetical protein Q8P18_28085 [Pseudomonadota bacterium]|nr:hypothetical protein [Pseudomonadota bacterium]